MLTVVKKSLVYCTLLFVLFKLLFGDVTFVAIAGVLVILASIAYRVRLRVAVVSVCVFVCAFILLLGLINIDMDGRNYFLYIFYFLFSLVLAIVIRKGDLEYPTSIFLLALSCVWMIYHMVVLGYNPDSYNNLIDGSRNYISGYIILFYIYYMYGCYMRNKNVSIVVAGFVVIACIFLYGRSGILLSLVLFAITVLLSDSKIKKWLIIIAVASILFYASSEINRILMNSNLSHGVETERSGMISEYLSSLSTARTFILGADLFQCCSLIKKFEGNPHNSFIMLHARFGILPFIAIAMFYVYQAITGRLVKYLYLNMLLLLIFARYFLDTLGFIGPVDFILLSIIFTIVNGANLQRVYDEKDKHIH